MKLKACKKAFTLAEVLITLSILGVVAALTIPSVVNRNSDIAAITKLKKAIATYERVAGAYFAESGKNNLSAWLSDADENNCENAKNYFKIVDEGDNDCQFRTSDGTFWVFNGESGNVVVYDTDKKPRYGVLMWTYDGNVNTKDFDKESTGSDVCKITSLKLPPSAPDNNLDGESFDNPVHYYYNATDFLNTSNTDLTKRKNKNTTIQSVTRICTGKSKSCCFK